MPFNVEGEKILEAMDAPITGIMLSSFDQLLNKDSESTGGIQL